MLLVGGGIAFQVWAQQAPEPMQAAAATFAPRPLLGSKSVLPQPPDLVMAASVTSPPPDLPSTPEIDPAALNEPQSHGPPAVASKILPETQASSPPIVTHPVPVHTQGALPPEAQPTPPVVVNLLEDTLRGALGPDTRTAPRLTKVSQLFHILYIEWAINDNLVPGLLIAGAQQDVANLLRVIDRLGVQYQFVHLVGTYPLPSAAGAPSEKPVLWLTYSGKGLQKIDWEQSIEMLSQDIFDAAEHVRLHAIFPKAN
jgi:hypothetical protein